MNTKGLNVLVTGEDNQARELATGIIKDAFGTAGFKDVEVLNPAAVTIVPPSTRTMLDVVKSVRPSIFEQPVRIQGSFADVENKSIKGAFGPEPVGNFFYSKSEQAIVQHQGEIGSADFAPPAGSVTLYVLEKDKPAFDEMIKAGEEAKATTKATLTQIFSGEAAKA